MIYEINTTRTRLAESELDMFDLLRLDKPEDVTITLSLFGAKVTLSGKEWNRVLDLAEIGLRHEVK